MGDVGAGVRVSLVRQGGGPDGSGRHRRVGLPLRRAAARQHGLAHVRVVERVAPLEPLLVALGHRAAEQLPAALQARIGGGDGDQRAAHLAELAPRVGQRGGGGHAIGSGRGLGQRCRDLRGCVAEGGVRGVELRGHQTGRHGDALDLIAGQQRAHFLVGGVRVLQRGQSGVGKR